MHLLSIKVSYSHLLWINAVNKLDFFFFKNKFLISSGSRNKFERKKKKKEEEILLIYLKLKSINKLNKFLIKYMKK